MRDRIDAVRDVVLAPGSRSAPLALALADAERRGRLRLHVRIDERSAAYLALGLARGSGVPVAVVTTSGTAAVNLHPAVVEAAYSGVPLVAVTADRPGALRGSGAADTMHGPEGAAFVHAQVEATKRAFRVRDAQLTDRAFMKVSAQDLLKPAFLDSLLADYHPQQALPWGRKTDPGDTIWMGVIDRHGVAVSFIQSIYHEFGSGVVLPDTGVNWQNRGCSFSLDPSHQHVGTGQEALPHLERCTRRFR